MKNENWKLETGNWKLETGKCKMENRFFDVLKGKEEAG